MLPSRLNVTHSVMNLLIQLDSDDYSDSIYRQMESAISTADCLTVEDGLSRCRQPDGQDLYVRNVYPPIQELEPKVFVVVVIFVMCFVVGICGTSGILTIIRGVMADRKSRSKRSGDNAILYIAALCVCDFIISLSLPPAILDSVIGFWIFGTWMCKIHHICGSIGKLMCTFLITAMSFDRYVAVCYPHHHYLRSKKFVVGMIICLASGAFLLLIPMLTYAKAKEMVLHELKAVNSANVTRVRVYKCTDMMPPPVFYWFTSSTFVMGYVVPLILIVFFNLKLIKKLYVHTKILPRSSIPLGRVVIYTVLIACVYFVCWTPYWASVLYAIVMTLVGGQAANSDWVLFLIYCVHLLPYFGSSSNWILYGLLNTQLQMKVDVNAGEESCTMNYFVSDMNTTKKLTARSVADGSSHSPAVSTLRYGTKNGSTVLRQGSDDTSSLHFFEDTEQTHL